MSGFAFGSLCTAARPHGKATMKSIDMRPGMGFKMDGKMCVVVNVEHRTPGNLRAFVQLTYREIIAGKTLDKRMQPSEDIEILDLDRREMEYLYSDSQGATFMDTESYEQYQLNEQLLGNTLKYIRANSKCTVLLFDGNPITIELPPTVELTITDCPPEVKGATVTNQTKDAECETGLKVRVPAFIKQGETIRISTADGSYQSRA
jgi:elongation factor P